MERRGRQSWNLTKSTLLTRSRRKLGQRENTSRILNKTLEAPSWRGRINKRAQDKNFVFSNLMTQINLDLLHEAFKVQDGSKALGVDKVSKEAYGKNLHKNLETLSKRLHSGRYRPQPKREVHILKPNGGKRPIAIACFEDKLVDWCVAEVLTSVFDPMFIRNSFGYSPNKSQHQAVKACFQSMEKGKRPFVVEIDFSSFFNTIPHKKLIDIMSKRVKDQRFINLVRRLLRNDVEHENGATLPNLVGTPQGGVASPILANIYLHEVLDTWFLEHYGSHKNVIIRFAGDAIFFFQKEETAKDFMKGLEQRVNDYGLTLNKDKCRSLKLDKKSKDHFHFLGFTFYWGKQGTRRVFKLKTQKTRLLKAIREFYSWIKLNRNRMKLKDLWALAKSKIQGHVNYYGFWMNNLKIRHFYHEATKALFKWLNRRSQRLSYTKEGFEERLKNFRLVDNWENIKWKKLGRSFGQI